jgi:hypothetical protein
MNKIRMLSFLILLALVSSSICWSQSMVWERASKPKDLCAQGWSHGNTQPPREAKNGEGARGWRHP